MTSLNKKCAFLSQTEIATKNFVLYNKSSAEDWKLFVGDCVCERETERPNTLIQRERQRDS